MASTKTLVGLCAALALRVLGVVPPAQASVHENQSGGYRIGPLGQIITDGVNPVHHRSLRSNAQGRPNSAFAYAPAGRNKHMGRAR
jgi:hypothetical protein